MLGSSRVAAQLAACQEGNGGGGGNLKIFFKKKYLYL
jgi:hypothetical protein